MGGEVAVAVVCALISEVDILILGIEMLFSAYFVARASLSHTHTQTDTHECTQKSVP